MESGTDYCDALQRLGRLRFARCRTTHPPQNQLRSNSIATSCDAGTLATAQALLTWVRVFSVQSMKHNSAPKLAIVSLVLVLALPYLAPSICSVLGRMGCNTEMTTDASNTGWSSQGSSGECQDIGTCGVTQVAPLVNPLGGPVWVPVVDRGFPTSSVSHYAFDASPLSPPPKA